MSQPSCVALIPSRHGSKRVKGKNVRELAGHPLIAYTIAAAQQSQVFAEVVISTDSEQIADMALHYGAQVPFLRPVEMARDLSPDIEWIEHALTELTTQGRQYDCFSILRPTSPFRQAATIRRAWQEFLAEPGVDSLRAVEKVGQHPGKMWLLRGRRLLPLLPIGPAHQPWHSTPYQGLPEVWVQNASLEIAWSRVVRERHNIAGETVVPFLTDEAEGFDINNEYDWLLAEQMLEADKVKLPVVTVPAFGQKSVRKRAG